MSYSGDAAEQVVRMSLEGVEVAAKITGAGAKEIALLLYAVLKDQKKTKGKTRLTNMLRSGKELKVFAVQDKDLIKFCKEAKKYGVLYCVLKDRDATDGITDVMVRAEDASKVNRIFERFQLTTVDIASVRSEIERAKASRNDEKEIPEQTGPQRSKEDVFLDALMSNPSKEEMQTENPTLGRVEKSSRSERSSEPKKQGQATVSQSRESDDPYKRPSVRDQMKEIRAELESKAKDRDRNRDRQPLEHRDPGRRKKKTKRREEK